jgi:tRNA threonylcarbamoyladenosine biosynthesis protein TsaE
VTAERTIWAGEGSEGELDAVAARVLAELRRASPFCLWLNGPLGAGKTALTRHLLRGLGLPPAVRVTSPTFTYLNEYDIGGTWYAHLDFYRAPVLSPEDLGLADARPFAGFFIEWPSAVPPNPLLEPTHVLTIAMAGADRRSYELVAR